MTAKMEPVDLSEWQDKMECKVQQVDLETKVRQVQEESWVHRDFKGPREIRVKWAYKVIREPRES